MGFDCRFASAAAWNPPSHLPPVLTAATSCGCWPIRWAPKCAAEVQHEVHRGWNCRTGNRAGGTAAGGTAKPRTGPPASKSAGAAPVVRQLPRPASQATELPHLNRAVPPEEPDDPSLKIPLPLAGSDHAPLSSDPPDDDDAYEPERPLVPSSIGRSVHESQPIVTVAPIELDDVPPLVNVPVALPVATPVRKTKAPQPGTEDDYLELARQRGLIVDRTPPPRPKWLFFSGVFGYPWRGVNLTRWVVMSVALCVLGFVGVEALSATGILKGRGENPILAIFLIMFTVLISVVTLSYASAVCQEIIQVTADGHDLPSDNGLDDWAMYFYALLGMAGLWVGGGALGYPLTFVFGPVACVVSSMIVFPVLLLSALETGSFIIPFSRPVFRSLLTLPSGWLGFYMLISLLWGPLLLAGAWLFSYDPFLTIFFWSPLTAALTMISARILGRLAYGIAAVTPPEDLDEPLDAAPEHKKAAGKRERRVRIVVPEPERWFNERWTVHSGRTRNATDQLPSPPLAATANTRVGPPLPVSIFIGATNR